MQFEITFCNFKSGEVFLRRFGFLDKKKGRALLRCALRFLRSRRSLYPIAIGRIKELSLL